MRPSTQLSAVTGLLVILNGNRPNVPHIPMICNGVREVANKMLIQPNAYVPDTNNSKARKIKSLRTRFLLPN